MRSLVTKLLRSHRPRPPSLGAALVMSQLPAVALAVVWLVGADRRGLVSFAPLITLVAAGLTAAALHLVLTRRIRNLAAHLGRMARQEHTAPLVPAAPDALGEVEAGVGQLAEVLAQRVERHEIDRRRYDLDARIQRAMTMADSEVAVVEVAARTLAAVAPEAPAEILLTDTAQRQMHTAVISASGQFPGCGVDAPAGCAAMRSGQTLRFPDAEAIDACRWLRGRPDGTCSAVCVPLSVMGRSIGVLHATSSIEHPHGDETVTRLEMAAAHIGGRLGMVHSLEMFQAQASTDPLTGLFNRRSFEEKAAALLEGSNPVVVAMCDLDHFKRLNDTAGHDAGDRALQLFAQVLRAGLRPKDLVARLGGEEFALVLAGCSADAAMHVLDRLREALATAVARQACPSFTVSFGVAGYPAHGATLRELLSSADQALYKAKQTGRDRVCIAGGAIPSLVVAKGSASA